MRNAKETKEKKNSGITVAHNVDLFNFNQKCNLSTL